MEFTPEKLSEARKYGYTDDEIWDFLGKQDARYGEAKKYGYSIDETITEFSKLNAPQGTSFTKEVEQIGPAFIESLGRPLENMGETFDVLGFKGVASALKGAITEPENYISASQRFTEPSPEEPQFLGFAWQYAPRAAVEQAGQALGSIITGVTGRAVGGLAGAPAGPAGAAVGQAVGAFVGPAIFEAAQIIGPIAKDRARNNGREVPTNDDILAATVAATGSGALNAIGAKYLPGGEKATVKFFKQLASSFAGEGLTEASQSIVEQIGSTAGTESGLNINYKQALAEGLIGGVTGAGLTGITAPFTKPAENQVIKTPEQAEEIDIDSKANEEALSLIGAPADQAKNDQIVKIKELESVIANNEMLSQALEPNTPEAQRIDLENKVARDEIEKSKVELEKSVGLTPVEDVKTIQKRIDDSKIQLTGLEPTSRKARSIEAQIAQDEARIKALSESIVAPVEKAVTPPVEPAPVTQAQPVVEATAVTPSPVEKPKIFIKGTEVDLQPTDPIVAEGNYDTYINEKSLGTSVIVVPKGTEIPLFNTTEEALNELEAFNDKLASKYGNEVVIKSYPHTKTGAFADIKFESPLTKEELVKLRALTAGFDAVTAKEESATRGDVLSRIQKTGPVKGKQLEDVIRKVQTTATLSNSLGQKPNIKSIIDEIYGLLASRVGLKGELGNFIEAEEVFAGALQTPYTNDIPKAKQVMQQTADVAKAVFGVEPKTEALPTITPAPIAPATTPTPVTTPPVTEAVTPAPEVVPIQRDVTKPEQMTPKEWKESRKKAEGIIYAPAVSEYQQKGAANNAIKKLDPISVASVDEYGIKLPKGYTKQGDLYVYQKAITVPTIIAAGQPKEERFNSEYVKSVRPFVSSMIDRTNSSEVITKAAGRKLSKEQEIDVAIEWAQILKESGEPALPIDFGMLSLEQAYMVEPALSNLGLLKKPAAPAQEAAPTGISVGNRIKLGKSPQTYIVEEVVPQTEAEKVNNEQFYSVKNERTGETQVVEAKDLIQVKGKGARKMVTATRNEEYMRLAQNPEANREQLQRMVDEAAKAAGYGTNQQSKSDFDAWAKTVGELDQVERISINNAIRAERALSNPDISPALKKVAKNSLERSQKKVQEIKERKRKGIPPKRLVRGDSKADITVYRGVAGRSIWATDSEEVSKTYGDNVRGFFLQMQNPLVVDADGSSFRELSFEGIKLDADDLSDIAKERGYDGLIIRNFYDSNTDDGGEVIADHFTIFNPSQIKLSDPVTYDDAGNIIPLEERFQPTSPDIRRQAIDTTPEGILITPPDQQYTFEEVFDASNELFGGQIPDSFSIINDSKDKDYEFKAAYSPSTGQIILNRAYLNKDDNIRDAIVHELGHYIYSDPEFKVEFDKFMASLSPDVRSALDKYVEETYNKETGEIRLEEKKVRAFVDKFIREEEATTWQKMINAIKKFLNKLGFKFEVNDRDAIAVFTAALNRYKSGEFISRTGEVRKMAASPRSKDTEESIKNAKLIESITKDSLSKLGSDVSRDYNAFVNEGKSEAQIASENNTSVNKVRTNIIEGRKAVSDALRKAKVNTKRKPSNIVVEWTTSAVKKYLTKEGNLPGGTFQNWVRRNAKLSKEAEEVRQATQDFYEGLRKKYNINKLRFIWEGLSSIPPEDVARFNDALAGEIPIAEMPEEIQGPLTRMRQHIDAMSSELIATGQLPEHIEAKAMENLGIYLTRSYKIFTDPKWINKIPQEKLTAARNFLYQQEVKRNPDFTIEDANRKLEQMLNDWQGEKDVEGKRGGKLGAKDLSVMMTRSDIPKQLRDVMGENTNVIFNYANTIAKISRFVADQNFLEAVKKEGAGDFLYTKDSAPKGFNTLIAPEESRTMSPLSGLRTSPEIAKAFEEFGKAYDASANPFLYMLGWLNAVGKANLTVGSVLTQMRNIIGQPFFFLSNGHTDIGVINKEVERIMKSKGLNKEQARNELVKMAAGEGLVGENAYAGEMREAFDQIGLKTFEDMEADEFSRQFVALRLFRKGTQGAQNIYQKTDEVGKMIGWLNETKRIQKMNPSMSRDEAMAIASERTRNTYPTYSQGSEALKLFRRQPFFGPFATFFYETFRTTYWNVRYAFEDINSGTAAGKQEGIKRLAGTMAQISIGAFAVNAISSMVAGIGDKEEEDVRRMLPPWAQDASLLWFPKTRDGVYDFINFSYINPYNALSDPFVAMMSGFSRGDDPTEIFIKAAGSFLSPFTSEQPVTAATIDALRNTTETGTKIYNVEDDLGTKTSKILLHIFGKAFTPGTIDRLRKRIIPALYGETVGTRAPAPLKEIGAELTGIRFENLDMRSAFQNKAWEFSRAQNDSERIFRDVATRRRRVTEEEQVDAYKKSEQSRFDNWQEMYRNYMAVRRAGASAEEAVRLMTDIKISKKEASLIAKGMYRPYEVSDEVRRRSRLNGNTIPLEQINQIRQSMPKVLEDVK